MLSQRGTEAFITTWLHFCNSSFADLPAISLRHLQLTLNFAVETWISEHFASFLRECLWFHPGKVVVSGWTQFAAYQLSIGPFHFSSFYFSFYFICCVSSSSSWVAYHLLLLSESVLLVKKKKTAKAPYCEQASQWLTALTYQFRLPKVYRSVNRGIIQGGFQPLLQLSWQALLAFSLSLSVCDEHLYKSQAHGLLATQLVW